MLDRYIWALCQTRSFVSFTMLESLLENMWRCTIDSSLSLTFPEVRKTTRFVASRSIVFAVHVSQFSKCDE